MYNYNIKLYVYISTIIYYIYIIVMHWILRFEVKITRGCNFVAVRTTVRRGLPGERIHIPRPADAAIRERVERGPLGLTAQRVELRR